MCLGKVSLLAHILLIYLRVHICNHRYVSVLRSCQHAGYLSVCLTDAAAVLAYAAAARSLTFAPSGMFAGGAVEERPPPNAGAKVRQQLSLCMQCMEAHPACNAVITLQTCCVHTRHASSISHHLRPPCWRFRAAHRRQTCLLPLPTFQAAEVAVGRQRALQASSLILSLVLAVPPSPCPDPHHHDLACRT